MNSRPFPLPTTWRLPLKSAWAALRQKAHASSRFWPTLIELSLLLAWALWAGHEYLNLNPLFWPAGNEYPLSVRENYFWHNLFRCGTCALWNGSMDGGYPALVDLQGAPLHPLVALPTLLFGVINGSKVAIVLGLALAGLAQWWLGRLIGLGKAARLWAALLAIVAGSITGRMESGLITLVISTASAALVIPAALNLWLRPGPRAGVLLAASLALLAMSGQGYMQIAVALSVLPALLIFCIGPGADSRPFFKYLLRAALLAALLAAVFLVPLLNQGGQMIKDEDPTFSNVQTLEYQPLNLVIRDHQFFQTETLQKSPYPVLFINYIGWVPLLLAVLAFRLAPHDEKHTRLLAFFVAGAVLVFLNSSLILPKLLFGSLAPDFLMSIRHPTLMAGLAAPFILALAAWGLDLALHSGPLVTLKWSHGEGGSLRLTWILLAIPLAWALISAFNFSKDWLYTVEQPADLQVVMDAAKSEAAQWVEFPMAEMYWSLVAFERDVKLTATFHPWHFRDREIPSASIIADRVDARPGIENVFFDSYGMILAYNHTSSYAAVQTTSGVSVPCQATATGGNIDVHCKTNEPGKLVIAEHAWPGWSAQVNYQPAHLQPGEWLSLNLPAGEATISLRYLPWDVPAGLLLSLMGIGLAAWMWTKKG